MTGECHDMGCNGRFLALTIWVAEPFLQDEQGETPRPDRPNNYPLSSKVYVCVFSYLIICMAVIGNEIPHRTRAYSVTHFKQIIC